jgi:hypothetical protein
MASLTARVVAPASARSLRTLMASLAERFNVVGAHTGTGYSAAQMPRFRRISDVFVLTILALSFIGSSGWARLFPSESAVPESSCRLSALLTAATRPVPHTTRIGDVSVTVALATGSGSTVLVLNLASAVAAVMPLEARWSVTGSSGNQYIQTLWESVAPFAEVSPATVVVTCRPTGPTGANNPALTINTTYSDGTVITLSFRAAPTGEDDHLSLSAALVVRGEAAANVTALRFVRRDVQPGESPVATDLFLDSESSTIRLISAAGACPCTRENKAWGAASSPSPRC